MNTEIETITASLKDVLYGQPWYGRPVYEMLEAIDESKIFVKPTATSHSLADLLYHMVTWAEFTQQRIEKKPIADMAAFDALDWRVIDPAVHSWQKGLAALKAAHTGIMDHLQIRKDIFLEEIVDYRKYNFRSLLNGLVQHNIYHLGQVAYLSKLIA